MLVFLFLDCFPVSLWRWVPTIEWVGRNLWILYGDMFRTFITLDFYSFPQNLCVHVYVLGRSTYLSYPILYNNLNLYFSSLFLFSLTVQLSVDWRVVLANGSNHFIYDGPIVFFSDSSGAGGLKTNNWKQELNKNKSLSGGSGVARSIKLNDLVIPGGQVISGKIFRMDW